MHTYCGSKRFIWIHHLVDEHTDNILITIPLWIRRPAEQQITFPFLKGGRESRYQHKLQNLRLQLLRVILVSVDLNETEEDFPFLRDAVPSGDLVFEVRGEEVEGVDVAVEVDA